jgi:hypothetical protein
VTLCISAICTHEDKPAIVLCSDWRSETGLVAGGDVQDKLGWVVPKRIAALKAGSVAEADRLQGIIKAVFEQELTPLSTTTVGPKLDFAMQAYRWLKIDHHLQARYGINYAGLISGLKVSPEQESPSVFLPDEFVMEKLHEIEAVPVPDCQLILAGFIDNVPMVAVVNEPQSSWSAVQTRFDSNFAAIGSGAAAALISLYRREHTAPDVQLMKACYSVYEAKLVGEVSPGVGDATSITVLLPNGERWDLTDAGHKYLGERFDYFGPLRYGRKRQMLKAPFFKFDKKYFEPYELPWNQESDTGAVPDP